jgi:ADP-dependent phosphofructokinase/glucokinase
MPLLTQADLNRQLRIWFRRLVGSPSTPKPASKTILSLYVSTIDRIIVPDTAMMQHGIRLAAMYDDCTPDVVTNVLAKVADNANIAAALLNGRKATTATHVLAALVARMAHRTHVSDRVLVDLNAAHILDFLNEWFHCQPLDKRREQIGGAPAIVAEILAQMDVSNVALWTIYHSSAQAAVFDDRLHFLIVNGQGQYAIQPIRSAGEPHHPEIRNYSMEFGTDTEFAFPDNMGATARAIRPSTTDRVISVSPGYQYFDSFGHVDTTRSVAIPQGIRHILTADPQRGPSHAAEIGKAYTHWILGGLQKVQDAADQETLESDLRQVPANVTIHVEISGSNLSSWYQQVLRQYVNSVGINIDDLELVAASIASGELARTSLPPRSSTGDLERENALLLAFWIACELDLERVYVHGLELDYIVRCNADDDEMHREVRADLLAKIVTTNRARTAGVLDDPHRGTGISAGNLIAFTEVLADRAYPLHSDWATLEGRAEFQRILDRGWFDDDQFEYRDRRVKFRVAVVPVALFRLDPGGLKFVGAGDTCSAVSFVFGCFTTRGVKRHP